MPKLYLGFYFKNIVAASLFLFIVSCAQVVAPTGGIKDTTPPKVLKTEPENKATNFKGNDLKIVFNEYISLKDANNQLLVSPPLSSSPDLTIKNKSLLVHFKDSLAPNTTYTFNFGNSIVDFTEGNVLENYQFVFSTGQNIDSLSITGKVEKAFDHATEKGILVMLYAAEKLKKDSFPYLSKPDYFAKTNEQGSFVILNVKKDNYKIIALKDANANYLFDNEEENIGFSDSLIQLTENKNLNLLIFAETKNRLYIKKPVKISEGQLTIAFNKPVESASVKEIRTENNMLWDATALSKNKDTLRYWYVSAPKDSLYFLVNANGLPLDTIALKCYAKNTVDINKGRGAGMTIKMKKNADGTLDIFKKAGLVFQVPVKKINPTGIFRIYKNDTIAIQSAAQDSLRLSIDFDLDLLSDSTYRFLILPSTFEDRLGNKNDTMLYSFRVKRWSEYGILKLNILLPEAQHMILQLLDEKEGVVEERKVVKSNAFIYENLQPGKYKLRMYKDDNNNGLWDTGKFIERRQAEKTYYFKKPLIIRANWDLEESWDLSKE